MPSRPAPVALEGLADSGKPTSQPGGATAGWGRDSSDPQQRAQKLQSQCRSPARDGPMETLTQAARGLATSLMAAERVTQGPGWEWGDGARQVPSPHNVGPATKAKGGYTYTSRHICLSVHLSIHPFSQLLLHARPRGGLGREAQLTLVLGTGDPTGASQWQGSLVCPSVEECTCLSPHL